MADNETSTNGTTATLEREDDAPDARGNGAVLLPEPADEALPAEREKSRKKRKDEDDDEREIEFETPFGKIELEFEPTSRKKQKDEARRARAAREAAKAAAKAERKLAEQSEKALKGGGRGGTLLVVLLIIGLIAAAIAVAWWLFGRSADELDEVPEELRAQPEEKPAPQSAFARVRGRLREAISAGRKASSETQREQMRRYEEVTRQS